MLLKRYADINFDRFSLETKVMLPVKCFAGLGFQRIAAFIEYGHGDYIRIDNVGSAISCTNSFFGNRHSQDRELAVKRNRQ